MNEQPTAAFVLDTLRLPFLGTRKGGEPFEYLLMEINAKMAKIAISKWMVNYTTLQRDEKVDLFLPLRFTAEYDFRNNVGGTITHVHEDTLLQEHTYDVTFDHPPLSGVLLEKIISDYPRNIAIETNLVDLLLRLIKDSIILKQGLIVYLKHFAPYFSRIVDYPESDYADFKNFVFGDLIHRIQNNAQLLTELHRSLQESLKTIGEISIKLNLEELREAFESEISLDLFLIAFTADNKGGDLVNMLQKPDEFRAVFSDDYYITYLLAIKNLEKRLYSNYNQIVLIYMRSISS